MNIRKEQKGITLVALIITIILLLILAVVAIRAVQGDGIIAHAKNAQIGYEQSQVNEQTTLEGYVGKIEENIPKAYKIGQKVMVGNEMFYVMADSYETQDKVILLAFSNIIGCTQFSYHNYWGEGTSIHDIVEPDTIPESHIAAKAAYDYGAKLGGTGRLMTYSEANTLASTNSAMIYGTETPIGYLNYWLGSAERGDYVMVVMGDLGAVACDEFSWVTVYGVRPVIEISKSKVSLAK